MVFAIAVIGGLMGLLFGYDEGVIAGTLTPIIEDFKLSHTMVGAMTGALPLGALFGSSILASLLTGRLLQILGRRLVIFSAAILFILGAFLIIFSENYGMLISSRIVLGLAIGIASVATPLYVSETAPMKMRGKLVTVYQLAITAGILISYLLVYIIGDIVSWRVLYAIAMFPALVVAITIYMLPESPRWLMLSGHQDKAKKVLMKIQPRATSKHIDNKYNHILETLTNETKGSIKKLFRGTNSSVLLMGILLFMFQQLSGINAVIYYAPIIFSKMGFRGFQTDILATIGIGAVNFGTTILALYAVEIIGRRKLLIFGFVGTTISLFVIFITAKLDLPMLNWITFAALIFYIFSFAISLGPLAFVYTSEIFPMQVRAMGMGISAASNWSFNTIVVFSFPIIASLLGVADALAIFGGFCFLGIIYSIFFAPETKGLSLEKIQEHVDSGKPLRRLGRE